MTIEQFQTWRYYDELEPFDERLLQIVKALWDIARDTKKHSAPFPLSEFMGHYGDEEDQRAAQAEEDQRAAQAEKKPDWRALKQVAKLMVAAWNTKAK